MFLIDFGNFQTRLQPLTAWNSRSNSRAGLLDRAEVTFHPLSQRLAY